MKKFHLFFLVLAASIGLSAISVTPSTAAASPRSAVTERIATACEAILPGCPEAARTDVAKSAIASVTTPADSVTMSGPRATPVQCSCGRVHSGFTLPNGLRVNLRRVTRPVAVANEPRFFNELFFSLATNPSTLIGVELAFNSPEDTASGSLYFGGFNASGQMITTLESVPLAFFESQNGDGPPLSEQECWPAPPPSPGCPGKDLYVLSAAILNLIPTCGNDYSDIAGWVMWLVYTNTDNPDIPGDIVDIVAVEWTSGLVPVVIQPLYCDDEELFEEVAGVTADHVGDRTTLSAGESFQLVDHSITPNGNCCYNLGVAFDWSIQPETIGELNYDDVNSSFQTLDANISLPVELTHFQATTLTEERAVHLKWGMASEQNSDYAAIQWSASGTSFQEIARVPLAGNTLESQEYSYLHRTPVSGTNYYRLKLVDTDGSFEYSPVRTAQLAGSGFAYQVSAAANNLSVRFLQELDHDVTVSVYDPMGSRLFHQTGVTGDLSQSIELPSLVLVVINSGGRKFIERLAVFD